MAVKKIKIRLQGHEKFALRDGWLNKVLEIVPENPDAFLRKDAPDIFGIGSNMVKSLRYWAKVLGVTNENGSELSNFGNIILKYDPYLENKFTWWLLHSNISKNIDDATSWYMYFNKCDADDLEKDQIISILKREIAKYVNGQDFSEKSLGNDVDVLLNMYSKKKEKSNPEDKNISPFAQLGLIKNFEGKYIKVHPSRKDFSEMLALFEIANMLDDRESISIEEVVEGDRGLEKLYNLSAVMANDLLDKLDAAGYLRVDRTAGLDMIYPVNKFSAESVVENYYKNCK